MDEKCLLAVYAHPDDEAFSVGGVLRKYSDEGVKTALICATRGEAGEIHDPALATRETLGQVREAELREACRILGVADLAFLDYHDGQLAEADEVEAVGRIVYHMRRLRPQVVVTFDPTGVYGHPDHLAVHRLTVSAFHKAGDPTCYPEQLAQGLRPYAPRKLYFNANPVSGMRQLRDFLIAEGYDYRPGGNAATLTIEQMGTPDEEISTIVTLDDHQYEAKMNATQAHRSQMNPASYFNRLPREALRAYRGAERFVLAYPPGAAPASESDLFAGI